jgi:hypothetical protein
MAIAILGNLLSSLIIVHNPPQPRSLIVLVLRLCSVLRLDVLPLPLCSEFNQ